MKRLEQLPEITEKALGGLTAGQHLKLRIAKAAMNPQPRRRSYASWAPALCGALTLAIALCVCIPMLNQPPEQNLISTQAAGQYSIGTERGLLDLENNNITIRQTGEKPDYRSIWAKGSGSSFPLIGIEGRYYRLLTAPKTVSSSLFGRQLGTVAEFTTEPALSGTDVVLSNTVQQGSEVYAISGMDGTLIAAKVDGSYRLFQRTGFNGSALRGSEDLADTLQIAGHIIAMELSDVGVITDSSTCEALFSTLTSCASYESSSAVSGKQSLLIQLDNGLALQLAVKNDKLSACGTWSCPEFFEAFEDAAN